MAFSFFVFLFSLRFGCDLWFGCGLRGLRFLDRIGWLGMALVFVFCVCVRSKSEGGEIDRLQLVYVCRFSRINRNLYR